MTKKMTELLLLGGFTIMAAALYMSTSSYPDAVQGSTANYVRFLAISLGLLCGAEFVSQFRSGKGKDDKKLNIAAAPKRFWGLLGLLFIYALLLEPLGFYIASTVILPLTMLALGARKPQSIAITTAGVLVFVFLVFDKLLTVPLPESILFS